MTRYAIPDPWVIDSNPFDFDIEGEGRRRQANAKDLNRVKPNAAQKAATRREITKWREAAKLSKEFNKFKKDYGKAQHEIKKFQRTTTQTVSRVQKALKPVQDAIKKVPALEKAGKEATRVVDAIKKSQFAKVSKAFGSKMAGLTGAASLAFGLAGVGLGLANLKLNEITDETQQNQLDVYGRELGKQLQIVIKNTLTIRNLEKRTAANDAAIDVMSAAIGEKTKYIDRVINEFQIKVEGQKTINDKQGDLILNLVKTVFTDVAPTVKQQKVEIKNLQAQVRVLGGGSRQPNQPNNQAQINQLNTRVNNVEKEVKENDKEIAALKKAPNLPANILQKVQDAVSTASNALGKVGKLEKEIPGTITKLVDGKVTEVVQASNKALKDELGIEITKKIDKDNLVTEIKQRNGDIIRVLEPAIKETTKQIVDQKVKPLEVVSENVRAAVGNILEMVGGHGRTINDHTRRIDKESIDNDKQAIDIEVLKQKNRELDKKIKEQEKVNQEGNKKLDDLLKWSLGIPPLLALIPRNTANLINPNIPTRPQIGQIVRDSTPQSSCRFSETPINNAASRVNAHSTALDVAQTGLITANTAIVTNINNTTNVINNKLGGQLVGGISGFLTNFFDKFNKVATWLHLDRALNILIWWQTLHNAYMLSNNLGQTLTSAVSNVLAAVGIKDAEGNPLDIGNIIGKTLDDAAKTALGEQTWGGMKAEWKKYNRIYQAAANLLNSIQSIGQSILSALEVVGSWVASIGNALRRFGEVAERAYSWMNPQPNFQNKFFTTLENVTNVVSQVDQIASEVLSVQDNIKQIGEQSAELQKSLKGEEGSKQGTSPPEAENVKKQEEQVKAASTGPAVSDADKEADD